MISLKEVLKELRQWTAKTRKRAAKDHAHKKAVKKQKQYLASIKTPGQLKDMRQQSRRKQKKR